MIRSFVLAAVSAACLCLAGCDSGGVQAVSGDVKSAGATSATAAGASGAAPKALPANSKSKGKGKGKGRSESPGPLPPPDV